MKHDELPEFRSQRPVLGIDYFTRRTGWLECGKVCQTPRQQEPLILEVSVLHSI